MAAQIPSPLGAAEPVRFIYFYQVHSLLTVFFLGSDES